MGIMEILVIICLFVFIIGNGFRNVIILNKKREELTNRYNYVQAEYEDNITNMEQCLNNINNDFYYFANLSHYNFNMNNIKNKINKNYFIYCIENEQNTKLFYSNAYKTGIFSLLTLLLLIATYIIR